MKNILSNGYNLDAHRYDTNNIYLHTFAKYWAYDEKAPNRTDYLGWAEKISSIGNPVKTYALEQQIEKLQKKEKEYYRQVLGEGEKVENFEVFMEKLKDKIETVQPCLKRLSNYDVVGSLFRKILNEISINGTTAKDLKNEMTLGKNFWANFKQNPIEIKFNRTTINLTDIVDKYLIDWFNNKEGIAEITAWEIEQVILPKVRDEIVAQVKIKGAQRQDSLFVPRLISDLKPLFVELSKQISNDIYKTAEDAYKDVFLLRKQSQIFSSGSRGKVNKETEKDLINKMGVKKAAEVKKVLNTSIYERQVREAIFKYFLGEVTDNEKKIRVAFMRAWQMNKDKIIKDFAQVAKTNSNKSQGNKYNQLAGTLGELSNVFLHFYLTPKSSIEWTGNTFLNGEQMRADVVLNNMGIQVKNFKESTIKDFSVSVKLHPYQLLTRLENAGFPDTEMMGEIMSNMMFNYDFIADGHADVYIGAFKKIAEAYMGAFLNFDFTDFTHLVFNDTVNFWQVGNMIVPASHILEAYMTAMFGKKEGKPRTPPRVSFQFPEPNMYDLGFHTAPVGEDGKRHAPPFTKYWGYSGNGTWRRRKASQSGAAKNLLTKSTATIHTSFNFDKLFMENLAKYAYLI
jgi:hypothetical protein